MTWVMMSHCLCRRAPALDWAVMAAMVERRTVVRPVVAATPVVWGPATATWWAATPPTAPLAAATPVATPMLVTVWRQLHGRFGGGWRGHRWRGQCRGDQWWEHHP